MLMLNNTGIGRFAVGVVNDRIALPVRCVQNLRLKTHRAVLQLTKAVVVELIDRSGINDRIRQSRQFIPLGKEIAVDTGVDTFQ